MEKNRRKREGGRREKTKSDSSGGENKGNPMREQEGEIQFRRGTDAEQESGQDVGKRNKNGGWNSKVKADQRQASVYGQQAAVQLRYGDGQRG